MKATKFKQAIGAVALSGLMLGLAGCGGSGSTQDFLPPALTNAPGGQWIGFYRESLDSGDPDPAVGTLYMTTTSDNGGFKGRMSFQYQDCQKTNTIEVKGDKTTRYLNGLASGSLDSISINNPDTTFGNAIFPVIFQGDFSSTYQVYSGSYVRSNRGNDVRTVDACTPVYRYTLANKGNWSVFPRDSQIPQNFTVSASGTTGVQWSGVSLNGVGSTVKPTTAIVAVLSPNLIDSGDNAFVRQKMIPLTQLDGSGSAELLDTAAVQPGVPYWVVVQLFDQNRELIALHSATLTFSRATR